jgi:hypothetical protein
MEQEMRMRFRVLGKAPNRIVALLVQAAVIAALIGIGVPPARAQLAGAGPGWQVLVNPYLWIPGVSAKIQTPLPQRPEVDTNVSFDRILAKLNGVPFEGAAELRYGPFSLLGDFIHLPVAANIPTRDVFFQGGKAAETTNTGTMILFYRGLDSPEQYIDVGAGVRPWGFSATMTLNPGLLPRRIITRDVSWADPLIAARYHRELGNGFGVTGYADIGGFGAGADLDWQLLGTVDYAYSSSVSFHAGYRSIHFDYQPGTRLGVNVHLDGPIFGGTIRF